MTITDIQPHDIVLLHVGGSLGSYGPIDEVLRCFPRQSVVVAFEARDVEEDRTTQTRYAANGVRTVLVNACIGEASGTSRFFVNKHDESSSMLPPGPSALDEHIVGYSPAGVTTWRQNTEVDRTITLKTISLDEFTAERKIVPDVVSLDAQGMEVRILQGAAQALRRVTCVVSEVEFLEIYSGQGLFHEQMRLLDGHGFRLADFLNPQYWHPAPACGDGFFTVAEALWFKKLEPFLESDRDPYFLLRGIKLAALALAFRRYSYAYAVMKELMRRDAAAVTGLCRAHGFDVLLQLAGEVEANLANYARDNAYFSKHPLQVDDQPARRAGAGGLSGRLARKIASRVIRLLDR